MKRRDFITLLGGAAAAWPIAARAQQPGVPVVGFLHVASPDLASDRVRAFHRGLGELDYVEGRNLAIEYRWAEGRYDRLQALAADLVGRRVVAIAATDGVPSARAAQRATTTIPIVFRTGADPVAAGLIASLNRPGGNLTGVTSLNVEVGPKRLEILHELIPTARVIALLINPTNGPGAESTSRELEVAARTLGLQLHVLHAATESDIDKAFETLVRMGAGGLVIGPDTFFGSRNEQLVALTLRHKVPTIYQFREFAAAGGLMSYGGSLTDSYRLAGVYIGRILNGDRPADLPVQQSTRVELIINLKTAKALGLDIPPTLLARADEVIE
jgi:putative ABC transport system substrate-binding protein